MGSFLTPKGSFPPVPGITSDNVSAEDRINAIDFVNRVNLLFEENDTDKIVDTFMPDAVAYHFHGTNHGHAEIRPFMENVYPYLIPGVSRHATNHIVDRDGETGGVIVRYHMHLIRYAWAGEVSTKLREQSAFEFESVDELPQIWLFSPMADRLKKTEDGWKIHERYLGGSVVNPKLNPK